MEKTETQERKTTLETKLIVIGGVVMVVAAFLDIDAALAQTHRMFVKTINGERFWTTALAALSSICWLVSLARALWRRFNDEPEDEDDALCARRLIVFLTVLTLELWVWRYAVAKDFPRYARFQTCELLARGRATGASIGVSLGGLAAISVNLALLGSWIVAVLNRHARR